MRKGKMEELKDSEERTKSIDKPVLVILRDATGQVNVVEKCGHQREDEIRVRVIQVFEPENALAGKIIVFKAHLSNWEDHHNEDWDLDDVVEIEFEKIDPSLPGKRVACFQGDA